MLRGSIVCPQMISFVERSNAPAICLRSPGEGVHRPSRIATTRSNGRVDCSARSSTVRWRSSRSWSRGFMQVQCSRGSTRMCPLRWAGRTRCTLSIQVICRVGWRSSITLFGDFLRGKSRSFFSLQCVADNRSLTRPSQGRSAVPV